MGQSGKLDLTRGDSRMQGQLQDGRLDGRVRIEEAGRPQAQLSYSQGELDGPVTLFHANGQVSARLPYARGRLHGVATYHAVEGWLQRKVNYRHGLMHGEASSYFPDGGLAEVEHYRDGVRNGACLRYHGNGQVALRSRYVNGRLLEPGQAFSNDGRPLDAKGKPLSRLRWWLKQRSESSEA
ncbi:toxin-antitoxin system YwqK family antitoxin [Phytopseudomonas dryadis]|uniref:Toxin-antitoxin system YwqK family antitoxin n=1 Tax=Phytopseudomonas dryadis TaxID=2487520 RepID=A0A4Q9R553_9GAMM|nr:toxin-antitoxin system YwqK family antitoxin [Pseudomonas dryadis]TBU95656.1 toxin-antitoxin system YwqK family antitoxin [Pseudomonas dryadis]